MSYVYGLFIEERASEEDGGHLLNRQLVMVTTTRAEAQEYADITDFGQNLTSRISCVVRMVEVTNRQYRMVEAAKLS